MTEGDVVLTPLPQAAATKQSRGRSQIRRYGQGVPAMEAIDLPVVLRKGEDGFFVVECPVIPGCIRQGKTREKALRNIHESIEVSIEPEAERRDASQG